MRHNCKDMDRPIKLPFFVLYSFVFTCLILTLLAIQNDFLNSLIGLTLMLSGFPVYFFHLFLKRKNFRPLGNRHQRCR